jgi:hypothetical protein
MFVTPEMHLNFEYCVLRSPSPILPQMTPVKRDPNSISSRKVIAVLLLVVRDIFCFSTVYNIKIEDLAAMRRDVFKDPRRVSYHCTELCDIKCVDLREAESARQTCCANYF